MDILFIVLLVLLAAFLVIVEALLIPGITVAAIGAVGAAVYAVYLVYVDYGFLWAVITLTGAVIITLLALMYAIRKKNMAKLELKENSDSSVPNVRDFIAIGEVGVAQTRLSPMGTVTINGGSYEAKSLSGMLDPKSEIKVVGFDDNVVTVEKNNN